MVEFFDVCVLCAYYVRTSFLKGKCTLKGIEDVVRVDCDDWKNKENGE